MMHSLWLSESASTTHTSCCSKESIDIKAIKNRLASLPLSTEHLEVCPASAKNLAGNVKMLFTTV